MSTFDLCTVIPVFRRPALLRRAVESVWLQQGIAHELIVVDDASDDDTAQVVKALIAESPIPMRLICQPDNQGPGAARDRGWRATEAALIQFLDSDDCLLEGKFARAQQLLSNHPDVAMAVCSLCFDSDGQRQLRALDLPLTPVALFPLLLERRPWCTSAPIYRRRVIDAAGGWPGLRQNEDLAFDAAIGRLGGQVVVDDQVGVIFGHDAEDRLSWRWKEDHEACQQRMQVLLDLYPAAREAAVSEHDPAMRRYLQGAFLAARESAAYGFLDVADRALCQLSERATPFPSLQRQMGIYRFASRLLGGQRLARLHPRIAGWKASIPSS
ncbi:glycosyltransferase family A protein [Gammaproteobacteria bacterium]|nr:glycosyltransferase family A protein [Gammaproteobacteria bacterium]